MNKLRVGEEDIRRMVAEFYTNVRHDELLGLIFEYRFQGRWAQHLARMRGVLGRCGVGRLCDEIGITGRLRF